MITIRSFTMTYSNSIPNEIMMHIMSKQTDQVFKPWLKERHKKMRIYKSVKHAKELIKIYREIKKRGQQTFNFIE